MLIIRLLIGALGVLLLAACGTNGAAVQVSDAWVRAAVVTGAAMPAAEGSMGHGATDASAPMASGSTSAAYMVIRNRGAADALIAAATDVADVVELHTVERDGDVMRMRPVTQIDLPANGNATLEPGGFHVMLIGLRQDLAPGATVRLTLTFANAGEVVIEAPVRAP